VTPTVNNVTVCFSDMASVTNLAVNSASGIFNGTTNLSATLTTGANGVSNKSISFTLNGNNVGSATTDLNGLATLSNVSLAGLDAGSYPAAVGASFAGDPGYTASSGSNALNIDPAPTVTTVVVSNALYDGNQHGATASATGTGGLNQSLSVTYMGRNTTVYGPDMIPPTNAGDYTASAGFGATTNYQASSDSKDYTIAKADQTITFNPLADKTVDDPDFNVSSTASSTLTVSFAALGQCSVSGTSVHLTGTGGCTITASQAGDNNYNAAPDVPRSFNINAPSVNAGNLLISEFRLRGPQGVNDEFIELYNNTDQPLNVATTDGSAGWAVVASDNPTVPRFVVPNGTTIPARAHFLGANLPAVGAVGGAGFYSLLSYAQDDDNYTGDIPDGAGLAVFRTADPSVFDLAHRLDAVGFAGVAVTLFREGTGLQPTGGIIDNAEFSFVRSQVTGLPQDTDDNAADFVLIAPDPSLITSGTAQLGAPGPENCGCNIEYPFSSGVSPTQHNATVKTSLIEPFTASSNPPNRVRDTTADVCNGGNAPSNCTLGTLEIRRRFHNNTGFPVTALRFRVVDLTTLNTPNPGGQQADIRWLSDGTNVPVTTSLGMLTVRGLVLDTPPDQPLAGGLNSTGSLTIPGGAIAAGATLDVRFLLGVQAGGRFRFFVNVEAITSPPGHSKQVVTKGSPATGKHTTPRQ
jgi:hypothetical protein